MDRRRSDSRENQAPKLTPEEIDFLMRQPIKDRPAIIIMGDEDVVGFDPPSAEART